MLFAHLFLLLPVFLFHFQQCQTCFSRGNSGEPADGNPEAQGLKSVNDVRSGSANEDGSEEKMPAELDPEFVRTYLKEFGHIKHGEGISRGIKHFQQFLGIRPTGTVNLSTLQKMSWKRCANSDEAYNTGTTPEIWELSTLFWNLNSTHPEQFTRAEMKELIAQAFRAWEIVIKIDFLETNNVDHAQIIFRFESEVDKKAKKEGEKTGLAVAGASSPPVAEIFLNADEHWSTFQTQEEGKIDIFVVLLHEIGHALGLRHSGDENSVMFPMFERSAGDHLPVISSDDVEHLRALYEGDLSERPTVAAGLHPTRPVPAQGPRGAPGSDLYSAEGAVASATEPEKCPRSITTAANVNSETLFVFKDGYTWHLSSGKLVGGPYKISEFFPDGPENVDVAFSSGRLTVLVKSRMLFGYEFDQKTAQFTRDRRYPRELHSRILFYPECAFPIVNGSIILLRDDVFATYNVESNTPHLFGSVSDFFPGLPQNLRSGFAASPDFVTYHMLTKEYAFLYDSRVTRSLSSQPISKFLGCDANGANGNKTPQMAQFGYPQ